MKINNALFPPVIPNIIKRIITYKYFLFSLYRYAEKQKAVTIIGRTVDMLPSE
jgi:hypothetical protein